ncbi:glycosyl hydrolase [Xylogone sp. PMI_703]|nr:glycosyl hydrolase [Xylogone sp. PMI_703]
MRSVLCASLASLGLQATLIDQQWCLDPADPEDSQVPQHAQSPLARASSGYDAPWRPQVHFTPPQDFMNDPNGLFRDEDGLWHLYYQYAPTLSPGILKDWGHATSEDLYTWTNHPIAILGDDYGAVWSGSIVIDVNNTSGFFPNQSNGIVAFYTNYTDAQEAQAIAYSHDGGYTFTKYADNPIISLNQHGFRDPKVIWYEPAQHWVMVVSHADEKFIAFYTSKDLKSWTQVSTFTNPGVPAAFECPQFVPMPFHSSPTATPNHDYYLLSISTSGGGPTGSSGVKYFPGTFNGTHFFPVDDLTTRYMDFGQDSYATAFFYELGSAAAYKPISISWATSLAYATDVPTGTAEGWISSMSLARTHYFANVTSSGYDLISQPVDITPMHDTLLSSEKNMGNGGIVIDYSTLSSGAISFSVDVVSASQTDADATIQLAFFSSKTRESITLGLSVAESSATFSMSRANITSWTSSSETTQFKKSNLIPYSSTSLSSRSPSSKQFRSSRFTRQSTTQTYTFNGVIDRTILDVFVNGGVNTGTMIFFPKSALDTMSLSISGFEDGSRVEFEAWGLKSGWSS